MTSNMFHCVVDAHSPCTTPKSAQNRDEQESSLGTISRRLIDQICHRAVFLKGKKANFRSNQMQSTVFGITMLFWI